MRVPARSRARRSPHDRRLRSAAPARGRAAAAKIWPAGSAAETRRPGLVARPAVAARRAPWAGRVLAGRVEYRRVVGARSTHWTASRTWTRGVTPAEAIVEVRAGRLLDRRAAGRRRAARRRGRCRGRAAPRRPDPALLAGLPAPYDVLDGTGFDGRALWRPPRRAGPDDGWFGPSAAARPEPVDLWNPAELGYDADFTAGRREPPPAPPRRRRPGLVLRRRDRRPLPAPAPPPDGGVRRWPPGLPTRAPRTRAGGRSRTPRSTSAATRPTAAHFATLLLIDLIASHSDDWFTFPVDGARPGTWSPLRRGRRARLLRRDWTARPAGRRLEPVRRVRPRPAVAGALGDGRHTAGRPGSTRSSSASTRTPTWSGRSSGACAAATCATDAAPAPPAARTAPAQADARLRLPADPRSRRLAPLRGRGGRRPPPLRPGPRRRPVGAVAVLAAGPRAIPATDPASGGVPRSTRSSRPRSRSTAFAWSAGRCWRGDGRHPVLWTQRRRRPLLTPPGLRLRYDTLDLEVAMTQIVQISGSAEALRGLAQVGG